MAGCTNTRRVVVVQDPRVEQVGDVLTEEEEAALVTACGRSKGGDRRHLCAVAETEVVAKVVARSLAAVGDYFGAALKVAEAFVIAYDAEDEASAFHAEHVDPRIDTTINVALSGEHEYSGGELVVGGAWAVRHRHRAALVHHGWVRHGALPVRTGRRRNLIIWLRSDRRLVRWPELDDCVRARVADMLEPAEACALAATARSERDVVDGVWPVWLGAVTPGRAAFVATARRYEEERAAMFAARRRRVNAARNRPKDPDVLRACEIAFLAKVAGRVAVRVRRAFLDFKRSGRRPLPLVCSGDDDDRRQSSENDGCFDDSHTTPHAKHVSLETDWARPVTQAELLLAQVIE